MSRMTEMNLGWHQVGCFRCVDQRQRTTCHQMKSACTVHGASHYQLIWCHVPCYTPSPSMDFMSHMVRGKILGQLRGCVPVYSLNCNRRTCFHPISEALWIEIGHCYAITDCSAISAYLQGQWNQREQQLLA